MKTNHKLAITLFVGISLGIAGATTIYAHQVKPAPGYIISEVDAIQDLPTLQKYGEKVGATLAPFSPHVIVGGGKTLALDGEPPKGIVVIAFDSVEKAREWYDSPAYQAIKSLRISSTKGRMFIAEGVAPK